MQRRTIVAGTLLVLVLFQGGSAFGQDVVKKPATLRVLVPVNAATLIIQGTETRQTGSTRVFESPPLEAGKSYTYTIATRWMPNNYTTITRTRTVSVKAGETTEADLRNADNKQPDDLFIRYVPTPQVVVEAMLKLANVGDGDVVYDLGCGDGRIVVTAVSKFKAKRGVGVDIDPERVADSKATAKRDKVEDKVEIRQEDVLKLKDLGEASVVMLYMGDDLNLRLRPVLRKTLKPGSRVVSHRFAMGDWKPDKTIVVKDGDGIEYVLHLWRIGDAETK
jgi:uncharacterized protein (TIGR03000 family)